MKLRELADLTGGRILGNRDSYIKGAAAIKDAKDGDITFLSDKRGLPDIARSTASAIITSESLVELVKKAQNSVNILVVDNPQFSFAKALEALYLKPHDPSGISEKSVTGNNFKKGSDVSVYPFVYIGDDVKLGDRVTIFIPM